MVDSDPVGRGGVSIFPGSRPEPDATPPTPRQIIARSPSKLTRVGLPENPDLEGLPEFFAVYADGAEWHGNRTKFSYWHPGVKDYAYFFEATRVEGGFHFQAIPEPTVDDETTYWDKSLGNDSPIRFLRSISPIDPVPAARSGRSFPVPESTRPEKIVIPIAPNRQP